MNLFSNYCKIVCLFALIGLLFAVFGCDQIKYSPSGVGNVGPQQPPDPQSIWISDSTYESDTLVVWGTVRLNYNFASVRPILKTTVRLNGRVLDERSGAKGGFYVATSHFPDGLNFLEFTFLVRGQTGSLVERINGGVIQVVKRYPIFIDNRKPPRPKITSMQLEDGTLRIRWGKYPYRNFQYYRIRINYNPYIKIEDSTVTSYDYSGYLGGDRLIKATLEFRGMDQSSWGKASYKHPYLPSLKQIQLNKFSQPILIWKSCPFYRNFGSYQVRLSYSETTNTKNLRDQSHNVRDTTYIDAALKFGAFYYYHVRVADKTGKLVLRGKLQKTYLGSMMPPFTRIHYIPSTNAIYLNPSDFFGIQSKGKIYRLNAQTMKTEAVFSMEECTFAISEDGKELFAHAPRSSLQNRTIFKLNPLDLSVESTISMDSTLLHTDESPAEESIVFIAPHALLFKVTNGKTERLVKYDYVSGTTVSKSFPYKDGGVHIVARSYLGKYLLIRYENTYMIYDVYDDTFVSKATVTDPDYFCFGPTADTYLTTRDPNIVIRNCDTDEIIKEISIDRSLKYPSVDYASGYLGGTVSVMNNIYYYQLYNLETQAKIFEIGTVELKKYFAFNNIIFSRLGLYLKVNY